ncbi:MAG: prenyltransferase [Candidatus Nanohaloarchaea archaeon]
MDRLKYLLKLSRPRFWMYLAGPALVGLVYGDLSAVLTPEGLGLLIYFLLPANIALYGINDYFDRDIDEENPKKEEKEEVYRGARWVDLTVAISAALSIPVALTLSSRTWPWFAAFLFLSVAYSAPPLRFKARPFLDSLSNGLYLTPFVIAYVHAAGGLPPVEVLAGGWLWTMAMHTFSAIPDIGPDRRSGVETTATFLGRERTYGYCTAVWSLSAVSFATHSALLGALFSFYPLLCAAVYLSGVEDSRAYWWYPYINGLTGMVITLYGLRVLVGG